MDTILSAETAHKLLAISLEAAIFFCDECILAGALPMLVDPLASGSVISRRTFRESAMPYQRKLIDYLHRFDLDVTLHICGDTTGLADLIPETGADLFSFDQLDVAVGVHRSIAKRVTQLVRSLHPREPVAFSGGVAKNRCLVRELSNAMGLEIVVPEEPEYIGALGAAIIATGEL